MKTMMDASVTRLLEWSTPCLQFGIIDLSDTWESTASILGSKLARKKKARVISASIHFQMAGESHASVKAAAEGHQGRFSSARIAWERN